MEIYNTYYTVEYITTHKYNPFQTVKHGETDIEYETIDRRHSQEFYTEDALKDFLRTTLHDIECVLKITEYTDGTTKEEDYEE